MTLQSSKDNVAESASERMSYRLIMCLIVDYDVLILAFLKLISVRAKKKPSRIKF